jgi:RNA polymerase sigma-70 factor (ECF subfamily)
MPNYSEHSDEELLAFVKKHDVAAFTEIYNRFRGLLYVYSRKITHHGIEAEDIVQDIFIKLWDNRASISLKSSLSSYLYTAVRYKFFDLVAHQKVRSDYAEVFQDFLNVYGNPVEEYVNEKELAQLIEREVANLPEKMRQVFELSRSNGLSHKEIALRLGIAEKTVKNQVNNALKTLRTKLGSAAFLLLFFYN